MIESNIVLICLCLLSFWQPNRQRFLVASVFAWTCLLHSVISDSFSDIAYYMSAGFFDLIVIFVICVLSKPSKFNDYLLSICSSSIFLNFSGYLMYDMGMEPTVYNIAFAILYYVTALLFMSREKHDESENPTWLWVPYRKCHSFSYSLLHKAKA